MIFNSRPGACQYSKGSSITHYNLWQWTVGLGPGERESRHADFSQYKDITKEHIISCINAWKKGQIPQTIMSVWQH